MRIEFTKMHGLGNDFIVIDSAAGRAPPTEREALLSEPQALLTERGRPLSVTQLRRLANRHSGIGFDQALLLEPPRREGTAVFYRIFNSDGAEVEQCGNGARCIAALLHRRGLTHSGQVTMDSPGGLVRARIESDRVVAVDMGVPSFDPASLPFEAEREADAHWLEVAGQKLVIGAVSVGNPHAVVVVESADSAPVQQLGPAIESHPRFPNRVNAGFMQIVDRGHIRLRVFERGAGETLACGTGACAAVAVGRRRGQLDSQVSVSTRGGELRVDWQSENIWLTGPAEVSFEGHVEVDTP